MSVCPALQISILPVFVPPFLSHTGTLKFTKQLLGKQLHCYLYLPDGNAGVLSV